MSGLFGGKPQAQPIPAPVAPPPPPTVEDATVKSQDQQDILRQRRGIAANILTSKEGAAAPNVATKQLLGG